MTFDIVIDANEDTRIDVLLDVNDERNRQDKKWGDQTDLPADRWVVIHGEEFGEVCEAILAQKDTDADNLYDELIQLAATCVAHAEALLVRGER